MLYDGFSFRRDSAREPVTWLPPEPGQGLSVALLKPRSILLFFGPTTFLFVIHYCRSLGAVVCSPPLSSSFFLFLNAFLFVIHYDTLSVKHPACPLCCSCVLPHLGEAPTGRHMLASVSGGECQPR
jgi:hypothetical protein